MLIGRAAKASHLFQEIDAMYMIKPKDAHVQEALRAIKEFELLAFERGRSKPAFNNLQRVSIAEGLRERVNDPTKVNQRYASLCGPAAFCYCLLNTRPDLFVDYVTGLYDDGVETINGLVVKPSEGCRSFSSDPSQIPDVDWIALASLRDSTNSRLSYSSPKKEVAGITMPHDMVSWFKKAGFTGVTDRTNVVLGKKVETLSEAIDLVSIAKFVCLFVNGNIVDFGTFLDFGGYPDHWIVLNSPLMKCEPEDIRISVYTYGKVIDVPPLGRSLSQLELPKYFFGYVSADGYCSVSPY